MDEIGARLREARMRAKIDINQVEAQTKIRAKYLRAMENEEWDLLPGAVYVKSFLRTYADYLKLDSRELLDDFRREYERPSDHELRPLTPLSRDRERAGRRGPGGFPPWIAIVVVLVIVGVALYLVGSHSNNNPPTSSSSTTAVKHHHGRHSHKQHAPQPAAPPKSVRLTLKPTGEDYVCLVNGRGRVLIPGQIFDAGQTIPVQIGKKLSLTLGNASMSITANGTPVKLTPSSSSIGLAFVPGGHSSLPVGKQPQCT